MNIQEIKSECEDMQAKLECMIPDDVNVAIETGKYIAVYHARTGYLLAIAKQLARRKKTSEIGETIIKIAKEQYLSAKAQNALVDSIADEEMFVVEWLDRINSMCVHQLDFIRSIISKEKEEMRLQGYVDSLNR
jgi:hypothetical protein